jgi:hypothetical protein
MRKAIPLALFVIAVGLVVLRAQDSDFQTGKIVVVEKVASGTTGGGSDASTQQNHQRYKLDVQLNGTVYTCRVDVHQDMDLEWAQGKDVPVRVKGKVLDVKRANGKIVHLNILSSKAG